MMKNISKKLIIIMTLMFCLGITIPAFADEPYKTFTIGPNDKIVQTQTAYEILDVYKLNLTEPEDMYLAQDGKIYIADTGKSRIVIISGNEVKTIGEGILKKPTGVFVKSEKIYVADSENKKVYIFDLEGNILNEIERPNSPTYGKKTPFIPKKLTVDNRGNIYLVSEGASNGLIQLNNQGEFVGYFGGNNTEMSFKMILQNIFFTDKQKEQLFKKAPIAPSNVALDQKGLVYTVTYGLLDDSIKKFNVSGNNLLSGKVDFTSDRFLDIEIDSNGNVYALTESGVIQEYDSYGNLLFAFGGVTAQGEINGLLKSPVALSIGENGELYVLDKERALIQSYKPTEFTNLVHKGTALFKDGRYQEGEEIWKEILNMNSSFILSYKAIAKSSLGKGLNEEALDAFKLGEDKVGYSEAFWEIRNEWLQLNLGKIIIGLIILGLIVAILKFIDKRKNIFAGIKIKKEKIINIRIIKEILYAKRFIRKPLDSYYELKKMGKVSILSASVLYVWFIILRVTDIYLKGYLFNNSVLSEINIILEILKLLIPIALWVIVNYMICTINDGEGKLKDVYMGTIYALTPYLIGMLPLQLITNILSLNESFIYEFGTFIICAWSAILMFLMVKEIHNYTFKKTVKIIFLTAFGIIILVLLIAIIVILVDHQLDFINSIIQELRIRG